MGKNSDFSLDSKEIGELERLRGLAKENRDIALMRRTRAILLLGRDGKRRREAAEICEVSLRSVYTWQEEYRLHGIDALKTGQHTGRPARLSPEELESLASLIEDGPEEAGHDTGRWTAPILADEIFARFSVRYSTSQVRRILHQLGFSVQYPKKSWRKPTL